MDDQDHVSVKDHVLVINRGIALFLLVVLLVLAFISPVVTAVLVNNTSYEEGAASAGHIQYRAGYSAGYHKGYTIAHRRGEVNGIRECLQKLPTCMLLTPTVSPTSTVTPKPARTP